MVGTVLVSAVAGGPTSGFPTLTEILNETLESRPVMEALTDSQGFSPANRWQFDSMRLNCTGNITSWIFRATENLALPSGIPQFGILNLNIPVGTTFSGEGELIGQGPVYEYVLQDPIEVRGDAFLSILFPNNGTESLQLEMLDLGQGNAPLSERTFRISDFVVLTQDIRHIPLVIPVMGMFKTFIILQPAGLTLLCILVAGLSPLDLSANPTALNKVPIIAGSAAAGVLVFLAVVVGSAATLLLAARKCQVRRVKRSLHTFTDDPPQQPAMEDPEGNVAILTTANPAYNSVDRRETADQLEYEYPLPTEPVVFLPARKHQGQRSLHTCTDNPQADSLTSNPAYYSVDGHEYVVNQLVYEDSVRTEPSYTAVDREYESLYTEQLYSEITDDSAVDLVYDELN